MKIPIYMFAAAGIAIAPAPALATDDAAELWLNPSVAFNLDDDTGLQPFRGRTPGK